MNKNYICTAIGSIGTVIAGWFGGWDASLTTLLIFMAIDYVTGFIVAAVFKKSPKTEDGKLESKAGFKGLCKKAMILFFVLIGYRLDLAMGASYIRDGVCIAFILNELISITENAVIMGVPLPKPIVDAINILKSKNNKEEQDNGRD